MWQFGESQSMYSKLRLKHDAFSFKWARSVDQQPHTRVSARTWYTQESYYGQWHWGRKTSPGGSSASQAHGEAEYYHCLQDINERYGVNIPYHTLRNRFLGITRPYKEAHYSQQLLSPEEEHVLVDWIHFYSNTSHPLSKRTIRKKVQCICGKKPSKGWIHGFLGRWPEITLGKPSGLDPKRAQALNRPVVMHCFEQLDHLVKKYNIEARNMYNMDEKGCQRGGSRKASLQKYFVPRTRCPRYKQRSANLELVTIIECVCADGTSLQPGFVFQGKEFFEDVCVPTRMRHLLRCHCPQRSLTFSRTFLPPILPHRTSSMLCHQLRFRLLDHSKRLYISSSPTPPTLPLALTQPTLMSHTPTFILTNADSFPNCYIHDSFMLFHAYADDHLPLLIVILVHSTFIFYLYILY